MIIEIARIAGLTPVSVSPGFGFLKALFTLVDDVYSNLRFRRNPSSRTRKQIEMRVSMFVGSDRYIHSLERVERVRVLDRLEPDAAN